MDSNCNQKRIKKAFCKRGHPRTPENLYGQHCRTCKLVGQRYDKAKKRSYWLKSAYKLSVAQYNKMLVRQNNRCAICEISQSSLKRQLVVDHDHKTGRVRGLLCNPCNNKRVDTIENFSHLVPKITEYLKEPLGMQLCH